MEFQELVQARASVRHFTEEPVALDDLRQIVRVAGLAPSVKNSQPWRFIAITNKGLITRMGDCIHRRVNEMLPDGAPSVEPQTKAAVDWFSTFFVDAPTVVAVAGRPYDAVIDCILPNEKWTHEDINALRGLPDIQSIGASIENLLLAATDLGYGACWMSGPLIARDDLEDLLEIEAPWHLCAMVAMGRASAPVAQKEKRPLEEILEFRP